MRKMNNSNVSITGGASASATRRKLKIGVSLSLAIFAVLFSIDALSENVAGRDRSSTTLASGAALFETNCARCHGSDGRGGKGPNLASEKRQAKWRDSDAKLIKKITNGGMFMPSFGKKLKASEIKEIADHVRTLKE